MADNNPNNRRSVPVPPAPPQYQQQPPQQYRQPTQPPAQQPGTYQPQQQPQQYQQTQQYQQQYQQPQQGDGRPTWDGPHEWDFAQFIKDYPTHYLEYKFALVWVIASLTILTIGWIVGVVAAIVVCIHSLPSMATICVLITITWLSACAWRVWVFFRSRENIKLKIRNETNTRNYNARQ